MNTFKDMLKPIDFNPKIEKSNQFQKYFISKFF